MFEADLARAELFNRGRQVRIENQPFQMLLILLERPGEVVTREELQKRLWPADTFVEFDSGLNTAIKKLRYALGDSADNPTFIETVPRRGYRFIAPVTINGFGEPVAAAEASVSHGAVAPPASKSYFPVGIRESKRVAAIVVAALGLVAVSLGFRMWISRDRSFSMEKTEIVRLTDTGKVVGAAIAPDGRFVVYALHDRGAISLWLRQMATSSDVQILPPDENYLFPRLTFSPDSNYIYFVRNDPNQPGINNLFVMPALGGPVRLLIKDIDSPVSFSPDGREFVFTRGIPPRNEVQVRLANAGGSGERLLATLPGADPGFQRGATWSPNGRTIVVPFSLSGKGRHILASVVVADGTVRALYESPAAIGRPLWLPDGNTLLLVLNDRSDRGQFWIISYPGGEARRLTNDLADYDLSPDVTHNGRTVVAVAGNVVSNLWVAPASDTSKSRQITSGQLPLFRVAEGPEGKLLAWSLDGKLWILNADGTQRALFTEVPSVGSATYCGGFVLFNSYRTGRAELIRVDSEGANANVLVGGNFRSLVCAPDGKSVFYRDLSAPKIWGVPIQGGAPEQVAQIPVQGSTGPLGISPDGKLLAYPFEDFGPVPTEKLAIVPLGTGSKPKLLNAPGGIWGGFSLYWSADGKRLQYLLTRDGATNIWEQPLDGGDPKQLTRFTSGEIFDFAWSRDRQRLLLSRGEITSDVVMLSNLR